MSINRVLASGRLTKDAELGRTQAGVSVLSFSLAINDRRKNNQTGEWEDVPGFYDCVIWGKRAEILADRLTKGLKVFIDGNLKWKRYERNGEQRTHININVNEIEFLAPPKQQQNTPNYIGEADFQEVYESSEIPF